MDGIVLSAENQVALNQYLFFTGRVILYYDHALTFPDEVRYIWSQPKSLGSAWFITHRYFNFVGAVVLIAMKFSTHSEKGCHMFELMNQIFFVIAQFLIIVLQIMRTYALYGRSRRILIALIILIIGLIGGTAWAFANEEVSPLVGSGYGCSRAMSQKTAIRIALPWWANFTFDCVVFSLTLYRTWSTPRAVGEMRHHDIIHVLWRDGALYFGVMALAYFANIMTFYFFPAISKGSLAGVASGIAVSMASRLLLNLRRSSARAKEPHQLASAPHEIAFTRNPTIRQVAAEEDEDDGLNRLETDRKVSITRSRRASAAASKSWAEVAGQQVFRSHGRRLSHANAKEVWEMSERA